MIASAPRRARRWARPLGAVAVATLLLSGCVTGNRGRLAPELNSTGDANADAVLTPVLSIGAAVYAAEYDATVTFDGASVDVSATQSAPDRRSLTIGDVRYLVLDGTPETCHLETGSCAPGLDPTAVSDVQMNVDFFGTNLAARIRSDAAAAVAPTTASAEEIQGRTATCVGIPLAPPASAPDTLPVHTYCVFDNGVLARLDVSEIDLTMTSYADEPDESQFTTTT